MSEIRATTISDETGNGPIALTKQAAAKAFVNLNGTGTIAARNSLNISSTTDIGNGYYRPNFANSMSGDTYTVSGTVVGSTSSNYYSFVSPDGGALTASNFDSEIIYHSGSRNDMDYVHYVIHGDLA